MFRRLHESFKDLTRHAVLRLMMIPADRLALRLHVSTPTIFVIGAYQSNFDDFALLN